MREAEILTELTVIFRDLFGQDDLVLHREITADQVEGWDSFTSVDLIIAVENHFQMKILLSNLKNLTRVGDFVDLIIEAKNK